MKTQWLAKNNCPSLILFFNGFSMDARAVSFLKSGPYDVLVCHSYHPPFTFERAVLKPYNKVYLIAWSMGVWAAARIFGNFPPGRPSDSVNNYPGAPPLFKLAINGTEYPAHDKLGIPHALFQATLDNWNDHSKRKFFLRVSGGKTDYAIFKKYLPERDTAEQKKEINAVYSDLLENGAPRTSWSAAVISTHDRVIPPENMSRFWNERAVPVIKVPSGHFLFAKYKSWDDIIRRFLKDKSNA